MKIHTIKAEYWESSPSLGDEDMCYCEIDFTYYPSTKGREDTDDPPSVDIVEVRIDKNLSPILHRALEKLKLESEKEYKDFIELLTPKLLENYQDEMASHGLADLLESQQTRRLDALDQ